ncbi:hypothetical protein ABFS82_06G113400 [Erythranthe guttata]|uniref:uncharacterized protein LOC105977976 n=1 Tax=Erythranthe guttata TaxID=4155 RepID=UPI00064DF71E|nr:PREDICTED: uncharacterized protein LOC105977976 [Erythranthe guttata]|eukprot:XP_012858834.1 PREDICTED: uncharacterized protein LOC105977976 [Erythranthe guttata]
MGRDWLYWVVGGGAVRPSSARRSTSSSSSSRRLSSKTRDSDGGGSTSAGCMCAVFHLFDLNHHHPFSFHHSNHFFQEESITSKGVEAPRNSLEKELEPAAIKEEKEDNLTPPVGIQIKTRISNVASKSRTEDTISTGYCSSDSPSAKTPSLVARLMGLDLLPDHPTSSSPSLIIPKQTKQHQHTNVVGSRNNKRCFSDDDISVGARSLPETPHHQISSARRSDSEYHYIHKENTGSRPGHYAKQIVKQVKENVGRRIGLHDITNRDETSIVRRRDQNLVLLKPTKNIRVGFSDVKKKKHIPKTTSSSSPEEVILSSMKLKKNIQSVVHEHKRVQQIKYGKKVNMMEGKKKKKKDPLLMSNEKLNISGPTLLPVKKDPSPPATKLPQKQSQVSDALSSKRNTQLSSNTSRSYNKLQPHFIISTPSGHAPPDKSNGCATTVSAAAAAAEYTTYVQKILKRTGIHDNFTPLALGKWHTPAHPLDPSIYYYLELFHPSSAAAGGGGGVLSRRCNRKLIFQLVDEILAGILRPHLDFKPWVGSPAEEQPCLIDEICKRIASFPAANCLVLEDVDSLVGGDLCNKWRINDDGFFEEEGERLVCEIEGEIVESLVREAVVEMVGGGTVTETETGEEPIMSRGGLFLIT